MSAGLDRFVTAQADVWETALAVLGPRLVEAAEALTARGDHTPEAVL